MEEKKPGLNEFIKNRPWVIVALVCVLVVLIIVMVLAFYAGREVQRAEDTVTPGVLTAAIVTGEDRFAYHDENGELTGIEPHLAMRLAEAEGLSLQVTETKSADEAVSLLDAGAADVAFGCIPDSARLSAYARSQTYANSGMFLVTALHDHTDSLALMTGYSVGVLPGVKNTAQTVTGYEYISPKDYNDAMTLGADIRDRVVNMGIVSFRDALAMLKSYPDDLSARELADGPREYYTAVFPASKTARAALLGGIINTPVTDEEAETETEGAYRETAPLQ